MRAWACTAQTHALGFYERAGFHVVGEPFLDTGIPHRKMVKELMVPRKTMEGSQIKFPP